MLWIANVFTEFIAVVIAADVNIDLESTKVQFGLMIVACAFSFLLAIYVYYKETAKNDSKLKSNRILLILAPFMVISGVALGICIGNNTDFGGGVPNHKANNGILVLKKLPDVSNNGYTSEGFVEEELYRNLNPNGDGTAYMTEVWMYAYREVTHDTEWVDGTVV